MLDWHPDIDCFIKILSRRDEGGGEKEDANKMISLMNYVILIMLVLYAITYP